VSSEPGVQHPALAPGHATAPRQRDFTRLRPPARRVVLAEVVETPLDVAAHAAAVADPAAGAVVTFTGVVRDNDHGRAVAAIEYTAHPTAARVIAEVAEEVARRSTAEALAVSHRLGELQVGDLAIVVAVSGVHRGEAFQAAAQLVEEVKHRLPVWKRQVFDDGTEEWVACP
jgi:molybdopterin synthase catalytic subunit